MLSTSWFSVTMVVRVSSPGGHRAADHRGGLADLAADLADRCSQLFGGARDGLGDAQCLGGRCRGILGRRAGASGRPAHGIGCRRHRGGADRRSAAAPNWSRSRWSAPSRPAPPRFSGLSPIALGLLLRGELLPPDHVFLEHQHRAGHVAEFVAMVLPADRGCHVASGKLGHRPGQRANRRPIAATTIGSRISMTIAGAADDPIGADQRRVRAVAGNLDGSRLGRSVRCRQTGYVAAQRLERRIGAAEIAHRDRRVPNKVQRFTELFGVYRRPAGDHLEPRQIGVVCSRARPIICCALARNAVSSRSTSLTSPSIVGLGNTRLLPDHGTHRGDLDRVHGVEQLRARRGGRQGVVRDFDEPALGLGRAQPYRRGDRCPGGEARRGSDEHLRPQRQIMERRHATQESHVRLLPTTAVSGCRPRRCR